MVSVGTVRSQTSALNRVSTELHRFCLYILVLTFMYKIRFRRVWMWDPFFFFWWGEKELQGREQRKITAGSGMWIGSDPKL